MFRIDIPNPIPKILKALKDGDKLVEELEERMYRIERLVLTNSTEEVEEIRYEISLEHEKAQENGKI